MKKVSYLEDVDRAKVDVEIELMRSLDSDFTVHLVCTFPDPMEIELCMILEYCVRGDFRNLIDEFQQLPQSEKLMRGWEYTAQITRALDHLHSHNVMHRDLKPANILVNQDGTIRLGDFGLSREMNEDYYLTIAGTKVYMAPEVHLLKRMNKSSDMFSLGVIIFQLITGHHPYEADSEEAMIDKIKKNKVSELPDWVSNQMKEVIKWMMNNEENHRPTTKMILSHDTVSMYLRLCEETIQSEVTRLTTEVRNLKAELSKLRPLTTTSIQQVKPEPKVLQIQQSVPPSLNPNMLVGIIPDKEHAYQQGLKIIHTRFNDRSTVAFNPIISNGIVRFGGFFERHPFCNFIIGIADSSAVFGSNKQPWEGENKKKTVCYWNRFENLQYSSAKGVSNGKVFEWGKEWESEQMNK
ncbi:MAG: putative protein kinase [Streblomastix strix]|uniref:Protein kinase domain-containing protein n=1 Tax=Streblomastix strix TaxID=222440 RepID=A0A5J4VFI0_9EUKA|nr:MAG: putative protein kinase [Streblomastix strix]